METVHNLTGLDKEIYTITLTGDELHYLINNLRAMRLAQRDKHGFVVGTYSMYDHELERAASIFNKLSIHTIKE